MSRLRRGSNQARTWSGPPPVCVRVVGHLDRQPDSGKLSSGKVSSGKVSSGKLSSGKLSSGKLSSGRGSAAGKLSRFVPLAAP